MENMKDDENLFVQTVLLTINTSDGPQTKAFIGMALTDLEEWKQIEKKPLGEVLNNDEQPAIMFERPFPIDRLLSTNPELDDLVDIIREEAKDRIGEADNS